MALAQAENIYRPRVLDEPAEDMWSWNAPVRAAWPSPTKQREDLDEFVAEPHFGTGMHVLVQSQIFAAPVHDHSVDPARESDQLNSVVVVSSLIDKALRQRWERRVGVDWQHEQSLERRDPGLRNALAQHMQNQFIAITAQGAQMLDDPDIRDVARGLVEQLRVLLDESEQVLAAPARLRAAARHQVLEEPMFSEDEVLAACHGHMDMADIRSRRADSMLLALPTDSGFLYPRFQFDRSGFAYEMVQRVNQHLRAADDPWGVASWWFSEHVRLGGRPADLMQTAADGGEGGASSEDEARRLADALFAAAQAMTDPVA